MDDMLAVVITRPGGAEVLEVKRHPIPEMGPGQLLVRVRAAGVNRADLMQRRGHYPAPPGWPADVPGLEYAGIVESVGANAEGWKIGDRVMGLVGGGGCAEFVAIDPREAIPVPERLSFEEAAGVPEVFITAHDALFARLKLQAGERLLVHAVGSGVGTAAIQLAKAAGATVLGTSRTSWKLERAGELGLDVAIDSSREDVTDAVLRETNGAGVQAILDLVGGTNLAANLDRLAIKGRVVIVGLTGGHVAEIDFRTVLRKRLTIVGTALRSRSVEEKVEAATAFHRFAGELLANGIVGPVIDRVFPIEEVVEAHRYMEGNANFGKIILRLAS